VTVQDTNVAGDGQDTPVAGNRHDTLMVDDRYDTPGNPRTIKKQICNTIHNFRSHNFLK